MKTVLLACLALFELFYATNAKAQSTFGNIVGVAQDSNSASVPGSTITIRNLDENSPRTTVSDSEGSFQFLNMKPGRYEITATKEGFAEYKVKEVLLEARQTLRVEIKLQVESVGAAVDITGDTGATINTDSGTISDTKNFQQVTQLPVNYRGATTSPLAAIGTVPGVQTDSSGNISVGGALPSQVGYSVDGVSTSNNRQNGALPNLYPSSEILGEFKVTAFNNNAEFAQIGDVTVTTRGGANRFHGSLFDYFRNEKLDSRAYFNQKPALKPPFRLNQFGGSVGGPIVFDRTQFFAAFERTQQDDPKFIALT